MEIYQKEISINSNKGLILITNLIIENVPEIKFIKKGMLNFFLKHTSASLTINEIFDYTARNDLKTFTENFTSNKRNIYTHLAEGDDDMPAHILS